MSDSLLPTDTTFKAMRPRIERKLEAALGRFAETWSEEDYKEVIRLQNWMLRAEGK